MNTTDGDKFMQFMYWRARGIWMRRWNVVSGRLRFSVMMHLKCVMGIDSWIFRLALLLLLLLLLLVSQVLFAHNSIWCDAIRCEMWMSFQKHRLPCQSETSGTAWRKLYFQNVWQLFRNSFSFHYLMPHRFVRKYAIHSEFDFIQMKKSIRHSDFGYRHSRSHPALLAHDFICRLMVSKRWPWWHKPTPQTLGTFGHAIGRGG